MNAKEAEQLAEAVGGKVIGEVPAGRGAPGIAGLAALYQRLRGRRPARPEVSGPGAKGDEPETSPRPVETTR